MQVSPNKPSQRGSVNVEQGSASAMEWAERAEKDTADLLNAAAGDEKSMLALYDRYSSWMLGLAQKITGDRSSAEDVIQDVFLKAWHDAKSFSRDRGTPFSWLMTMTRNRAIDVLRSQKRRAAVTFEELFHGDSAPGEVQGSAQAGSALDLADRPRFRAALVALSEEQQRLLTMSYFEGWSHAEISDELGWPIGTVKTRIAATLKQLREVFGC